MAVRSFNIAFSNQTSWPLQRVQTETSSGTLVDNVTLTTIPAGQTFEFETEDDGVWTGTEAGVVYQVMDNSPQGTTTWILLNWQNPYIGTTTFNPKIFTYPIDANGSPLGNSGPSSGSGSGFNIPPPISLYECTGGLVGGGDGTDPGYNFETYFASGLATPFFALGEILGNAGNIPNAQGAAVIAAKPFNLLAWTKRHKIDVSKGIRALNPPNRSLRALMQLPPAR